MKGVIVIFFFGVIFSCGVADKTEKQPAVSKPEPTVTAGIARITDGSKLFSLSQQDSLLTLLQEIERSTGSQVGIYTLDTLMNRRIETVSLEKAEQLQLGRTDFNDGILITIALKNRKMRMEIGEGLENIISDRRAAQIISETMAPDFSEGKYFEGVVAALDEIRKDLVANKDKIGTKLEVTPN